MRATTICSIVFLLILTFGTAVLLHAQSTATPQPSQDFDLAKLAWLAGAWGDENDTQVTEEHWTKPRGGMMLGMNRTVMKLAAEPNAERAVMFEFLRIEQRGDDLIYCASPRGRHPATEFKAIKMATDGRRIVFENKKHDFPQIIVYEHHEGMLHAEIQGVQNGKPAEMTWAWKRLK